MNVWCLGDDARSTHLLFFLGSFMDGLSGESEGCICGRHSGNREMGGGGTSGTRYSLFSLLKFAECE